MPLAALGVALTAGSILLVSGGGPGQGERPGSLLKMMMGDSRRLFAGYFFTRADVFLHAGYYPTIFDPRKAPQQTTLRQVATASAGEKADPHDHDGDGKPDHAAEEHPGEKDHDHDGDGKPDHSAEEHAGEKDHDHDGDGKPDHAPGAHGEDDDHDHADEHTKAMDFLGKPANVIDKFGRHFFPSEHRHLAATDEREILPWLRLAAQMDPGRVETYTVAAYFLRQRLNKPKEAEGFLREGLRENPGSFEILFELGRLVEENQKDLQRARNIYELAYQRWMEKESGKEEPNLFSRQQILSHLAGVVEAQGERTTAIGYWREYLKVAVNKPMIQQHIDKLSAQPAEGKK